MADNFMIFFGKLGASFDAILIILSDNCSSIVLKKYLKRLKKTIFWGEIWGQKDTVKLKGFSFFLY